MNAKDRGKLAAKLDGELKWFQKAGRHFRARNWMHDMRTALGIPMGFLAEELDVTRWTLYRAERKEAVKRLTIEELEILAEAMECKLVFAMVPERGTVAELAADREKHPRKGRKQREKEHKEYMEWYAKEVEKMQRLQDPVGWELRRTGFGRTGTEGPRDQGTEGQGSEEQGAREQGSEGAGAVERSVVQVRPPGVRKLLDAVAGMVKEMGPEKEQAIRQKAAKKPWDQPTAGMSPAAIELLRLSKEEWEKGKEQGEGNRE